MQERLDILDFFSVSTNLTLLLSLFLSKEQITLFKANHSRTVVDIDSESSSGGEADKSASKMPNLKISTKKLIEEKQRGRLIEVLQDYPVRSELDHKLIKGIFGPRKRPLTYERQPPPFEFNAGRESQKGDLSNTSRQMMFMKTPPLSDFNAPEYFQQPDESINAEPRKHPST